MNKSPSPIEPLSPPPGLVQLFVGFLSVAVIAFGGVLPIARRALVERYRWITPDEFTELIGLAQFLPGPNIINLAIVVGGRFCGPAGSVVAFLGLVLVPGTGVVLASILFSHYADVQAVSDMLAGLAAAAAGLVLAMGVRMAEPIYRRPRVHTIAIAAAAFIAIAVLGLSLPVVMLTLGVISIALSWWVERRPR
ncbi:chromate transporter [Ancylobacter mangrovi]|uniref:Chromate transporter n=1 Tax=Ancylobacter mangrovi TaxID=2972472 RepID=A0A9X2T6G1_9HYPH|nr:chromate transporter [Ancylobacter mangrovi]MCS0494918.1 chromate transporter [Ancylobacter mangrovi]MCS0502313.1 chromate transporter [Ancylobacter mangrovi]